MAKYTFITDKGEAFGPEDIETLKEWCKEGRLRSNSRLIEAESGRPLTVAEVPELRDLILRPPMAGVRSTPDLVAGIVSIGIALVWLGYGIDRIGQMGEASKAGSYFMLFGVAALVALAGIGIAGGKKYGFLAGVIVFGLNVLSGFHAVALASEFYTSVSFLIGLSFVVCLANLVYCVLRLAGAYGDTPLAGFK